MSDICLVVGIAGATCSGKTTLAQRLHENLKNSVLVNQDEYFLPCDDPRHVIIPEINHQNWELMTSLDMKKMIGDVERIIAENDRNTSNHSEMRVLILDGFLLFNCKKIAELCDLRYFLDMTKEQCWDRRKVRIYEPPDPPNYFEKIVWPEYVKSRKEILEDKPLAETITFINGAENKEEVFEKVFNDVKLRLSCK